MRVTQTTRKAGVFEFTVGGSKVFSVTGHKNKSAKQPKRICQRILKNPTIEICHSIHHGLIPNYV
jgi:phosphoribosylformylglycinamidine (FGAM) synthase PurS component